jgi:thioredoxin 1
MVVQSVTDSNFQAEVLSNEKPVLVDFWAPWCGPCRMVSPVVEAVGEKFSSSIKTVKLNTDENMTTSSQYQITGIPSLLVFKGGQEIDRIVGYMPQDALEAKLAPYVG